MHIKHCLKKSISAFNSENTSLYISALSNDANVIETDYLANIFNLLVNILLFCGAFVMMIFYSSMLTLATVILLLLPIGASIASGNKLAKAEEQVSDQNESMLAALKDSLTGFSVIKSFKAEKRMCAIIKDNILKTEGVKCRKRKISLIVQALAISAGYITQLGIFIVGAWLVVSGKNITPGTVLVFTQLIKKLASALSDNVREEGKDIGSTLKYGITLENVSFSYDGEKEAIKEVNYCFHKGKSYAVVGGSGSGKSTILNLLMGGRNNFTGRILYYNDEIRQISGQSLYDLVSLVQQNVFVFNSSIKDNITMFNDFGDKEVAQVIEMSGLSKFIEERGTGYMCGENGRGLSGGEKQRISIARGLLRHTQVLLVDEATSALDSETASHVTGSILNLKDITRIIVTHRLDESQLRKYDSIIAVKTERLKKTEHLTSL